MPGRHAMLTQAVRGWIVVFIFLAAVSACSEKGRSVVRVRVDAEPTVAGLATVTVVASQGGREVGRRTFDWMSGVNELGVYVSKDVTGSITITVTGYDASGTKIAEAMTGAQTAVVQPGDATETPLSFHLIAAVTNPGSDGGTDAGTDGGVDTAGSTGGAGAAATGGAAGGAGGAATGGVSAGTGGAGGAATGGAAGGAAGAGAPTWRGQKMVEGDVLFDDWTPAVAVDASGNAVVTYRHGPGIRASRFTAATNAWTTPVVVESRSGQAYSPSIAVDKNGQWLLIWQQMEGMPLQGIWQSTSTDGLTWTAPAAITTASASEPELAMNRDGVAAAAWYGRATNGSFVATASIRTGGVWAVPTVLKGSNTANGYPIQKVAVSGTGEAFVVWEDPDDGPARESSIWMRRYTSGVWAPASLVETYDGGRCDSANVAANSAGQAVITWRQSSATVDDMMARRYSPTEGLTAAASLGQGTWISWDPVPSVALDDAGVATIAWAFQVQAKFNVYSSRAAHGQPWPAQATAVETDNQAAAENNSLTEPAKPAPIVRVDSAGTVTLAWRKRVGARFDVWARRFSAGAWGTPALLETTDQTGMGASYPALGVGPGTAVTAWYYQGENRIWANVLR